MKNLQQFKNYDIGGKTEEVMERINFIEGLITLKRYDYIPLEARKILEVLLVDNYKAGTLGAAIKKFIAINNIPQTIIKALRFIKEKGNEAAHSLSLFEKNYGLEADLHSAIELQKSLFIVLRYFVELTSDFSIDISTIKFGDIRVEEKINRKVETQLKEPISNQLIKTIVKNDAKRMIQTVGMSSFVNYFGEWNDIDRYVIKIMKETNITLSSAKTKASTSKRIVKQGYAKEVLRMISESRRVDQQVAKKAEKLLKNF